MNDRKYYRRMVCAVITLIGLTVGVASAQPLDPRGTSPVSGVVDWVDPDGRAVVINDRQFILSTAIPQSHQLKAGAHIRFRYVQQADQKVITEILR